MSGMLEQQYILNISGQLDLFKTVEPMKTYNFRCNICGDSDTRAHITRGYFFYAPQDDIFMFKCHNCGASFSFQHYLKLKFNSEYKDLRMQMFKDRGIRQFTPKVEKDFKVDDIFDKEYQESFNDIMNASEEVNLLVSINKLSKDHPAVVYLKSRHLPDSVLSRLKYTDNYENFIRSVVPADIIGERNVPSDPRIVFEFKTIDNEITGFQGRCIGNDSTLRFSIIMMAKTYPKMFGLENIEKDSDSTIFVTEGSTDSLFLPNSLAVNGGDIGVLNDVIVGEDIDRDRFVVILDNEPRSEDTIKRNEKAINSGFSVVIWDGVSEEYKDINEMIINNVFTEDSLLEYVVNNNYKKTKAILKLKHWSKF